MSTPGEVRPTTTCGRRPTTGSPSTTWTTSGSGGTGRMTRTFLKFSRTGEFLASYGEPEAGPADSNSETRFNRVAKLAFDAEANEAYLADGYGGRRVAVLDASTGAFKRYWGAYGNEPDDTRTPPYDPDAPLIQQFRTPVHCADPSLDGHVYVCDRPNNRIQVFTRDGDVRGRSAAGAADAG